MLSAGPTSFFAHLIVACFWYLRTGPPAADAPLERARVNWTLVPTQAFTCPAACPAPSLAFCAGPFLDVLGAYADAAVETSRGLREWLPALCFGAAGIVIGRLTAPARPAPLRRPHGSRLREADGPGRART